MRGGDAVGEERWGRTTSPGAENIVMTEMETWCRYDETREREISMRNRQPLRFCKNYENTSKPSREKNWQHMSMREYRQQKKSLTDNESKHPRDEMKDRGWKSEITKSNFVHIT